MAEGSLQHRLARGLEGSIYARFLQVDVVISAAQDLQKVRLAPT